MDEKYWKISMEEEFKRNKVMKSTDITMIQEWIRKQPHLPSLNDHQVVLFLRACNYSLEKTKDVIDLNYTMRTRLPDLFSGRDLKLKWLQTVMAYLKIGLMPERDLEGNVVLMFKVEEMDLANWNMDEYVKLSFMVQDMSNLTIGSVPGYTFVYDIQHLTFGHILQCPLSTTSNLLKFAQDASTCVIKGIHYINGGSVIEKLFSLINPFLNADVKKMIKIHPNLESLQKAIGKQCIPLEYGGTGPSLIQIHDRIMSELKSYQPWFDEEVKQRVDEKKRNSFNLKDYGIQGSFKKIDID